MNSKISPVLLLAFNRPLLFKRVMEVLIHADVKKLYINIDGPRMSRPDDIRNINEILGLIDAYKQKMDISVRKLSENHGCKKAVSSGIDWFFEQVEEGIILESDCLPDRSFFAVMSDSLEKYRDDRRIMQISGFNPLDEMREGKQECFSFLSRHAFIWGWATWRRAWKHMDLSMSSFPELSKENMILTNDSLANKFMIRKWEETYKNKNNSWAYAWSYCLYKEGGYSLNFSKSLVENIGINELATHTKKSSHPWSKVKSHELCTPFELVSEQIDIKRETQLFYAMHKPRHKLIARAILDKIGGK